MSKYHRLFIKGGTYFFTVVTYKRYPVFAEEQAVNLLEQCIQTTKLLLPFDINATVILPDHIHSIWTLPDNDCDFSNRWRMIKGNFSHRYSGFKNKEISKSIITKHEKGIWQRRFWEHAIADEEDFERHFDYIHYNPIKHGFVDSPIKWKYSSFKNLVEEGFYPADWGTMVPKEIMEMNYE